MAFVGKLAYLFLFPGLLFVLMSGLVARAILAGMSTAVTGGPATTLPGNTRRVVRLIGRESLATGGALNVLQWAAPAVKLLALSWVSCILIGFLPGDLVLLFALLLLTSSCDLVLVFCSANPRVRQNGRAEAACALGWAVPLALVLAGVALRTGEVGISPIIRWQAANGVLVASSASGVTAAVGSALGMFAAFTTTLCLARMKPLGRGLLDDPPGGIASDLSGPPLAMLNMSQIALYFVVPLLLVVLFLAGPASTWHGIAFWVLKVGSVVVILGVFDLVSSRARSGRALAWSLGVAGGLALAGLVLVWIGVSG